MRVAALVAFLLAQSIEPVSSQQDPPFEDHSVCATRCAATPRDSHTHKACACGASKGETCSADGKRTTETMPNCKNAAHCKRLCCDCCPKD